VANSDHYTLISADTHAGGSHAQYREFLDPKYHDAFDAWRGEYRNPFSDLGDDRRLRNWDDEMRNRQQDADGVVGEVIFPNTVPPFFPTFVLFAPPPKPEDYELRLAGVRAHNRWLEDFCGRYPERRAGIGQIFINDIDDAIEDVKWIKKHNLRGGFLLPITPPDIDWIKPLNHPDYDRLWAVCEDLQVPINIHGGTGLPSYLPDPSSSLIMMQEISSYSRRPLLFMLLSGVFERFPKLKFVIAENGCDWLPEMLTRMDDMLTRIRDRGQIGELRYKPEHILPKSATEYFEDCVWIAPSFPSPKDVEIARKIGLHKFMWGSDYPHDEATSPFSKLTLRQTLSEWSEAEVRQFVAGTAADVYGFDLAALQSEANRVGPTVKEISTRVTAADIPENINESVERNMLTAV